MYRLDLVQSLSGIYIYIHTTEAFKVYDKVKKKELRQPKVMFDDLGTRRILSHRRYTEM